MYISMYFIWSKHEFYRILKQCEKKAVQSIRGNIVCIIINLATTYTSVHGVGNHLNFPVT